MKVISKTINILIFTFSFLFFSTMIAQAHKPLFSVDDNEDGTVSLEGGFSTGASAVGVKIYVVEDKKYSGKEETFEGKRILFKGKLDDDSCLTFIKPDVSKYLIYFDAGPGHIVSKKGPKLTDEEREEWLKLKKEEKKKK